jgi:uncharacterized membrane protein required for colicin V production
MMLDLPALPTTLPIETAGWHWLDVTLGICLAIVTLNAARRGFLREAGTLVGLGVGIVLAGRHALALADVIAAQFGSLPFLDEGTWLGIVLLSASAGAFIADTLRSSLPLPGLGMADCCFGLAFGMMEGAAGLGLVLLVVGKIGMLGVEPPAYDGSLLAPVLLRWWLVVAAVLPPELGIPRAI